MKNEKNRVGESLVLILQFGINMIVPIAAMSLLGWWLGEKTGIKWMMIPFFFVGAVAGGNGIYRLAKKQIGKNKYDYPTAQKDKRKKHEKNLECDEKTE